MKMECDYLNGWKKGQNQKRSHTQKISPKMVNPRDIAGNAEEEKDEREAILSDFQTEIVVVA